MEKGATNILYVNIKKKFKDFYLDIEFDAKDETLALLGPSGCGKSMTLKCIAGVETPDEGLIILNGKTLFDSSKKINLIPQQRKVGLLFQNYALFPNMTLEQNIAIAVPKNHIDKNKVAKEKIDAFSLQGLEDNYPSQLSGGQQQRVALARMLVNEPELLLLDEPFSALDTYLRWQMEQELLSILKNHKGTTLYVSHNRDEVYRISDRIAVIYNGRVENLSGKLELFLNPNTFNSAVLTGCKNISKAKKIDQHKIYAVDWNLELVCDEIIEDNIKFVGIRAHSIKLSLDPTVENTFNLKVVNSIDDLFSKTLVLSNKEIHNTEYHCPIYMDLSKEEYNNNLPNSNSLCVKFDKNSLLLIYS